MEVIKEDKSTQLRNLIRKIQKAKIRKSKFTPETQNKKNILNETPSINDEKNNIGEKALDGFQKLKEDTKNSETSKYYLSLIESLHQKECGEFARFESVRNYLMDGEPLLIEDKEYLDQQKKKLIITSDADEEFDFKINFGTCKDSSEPQTILIDDIETNPTHNFNSLAQTISHIIKDSTPHFTIGIYGEWGTGKTTLMKSIERHVLEEGITMREQKIFPIWFNAWQYEHEENLASLSLLKTVAYELANHQKFGGMSKTILNGLTITGKDLIQDISLKMLSNKENIDDELENMMDFLNGLARDSIYFEGLKKIKSQMQQIRESEGKDYRIVVFIDDLDRCSPEKALQVLESIKLFLDIEGFVFVIGLSHKSVTNLISHAYKITGVKGEDYLKKIIQIPIKIPTWYEENIVDLIENKITKNLHEEYTNFLRQNSAMVAKVVEYNPRQLKRFINNVIIAFETFTNKKKSSEIKFNEIFLVKILKAEWPDFYKQISSDNYFRDIVRWMVYRPKQLKKYFKYIEKPTDEEAFDQRSKRLSFLNKLSTTTNERITPNQIDILADFENDTWIFFEHVQDVMFGIEDWNVIDKVMDVVEEFSYDLPIASNKSKE